MHTHYGTGKHVPGTREVAQYASISADHADSRIKPQSSLHTSAFQNVCNRVVFREVTAQKQRSNWLSRKFTNIVNFRTYICTVINSYGTKPTPHQVSEKVTNFHNYCRIIRTIFLNLISAQKRKWVDRMI